MTDERPKPQSVKLAGDVVESARIVAAFRNVAMGDLVSDILRPIVAKMEEEAIAKRTKAIKPKGKDAK